MTDFQKIFNSEKPIIGMVHLQALPGTPMNKLKPGKIIELALQEAQIYADSGISAVIIENMHDRPYLKSNTGHEISSLMAIIGHEIKQKTKQICGIQILAGANNEAIAVANSAGLDFIRAEGFVFGHLADEGYIESSASKLLRYRKQIDAGHIMVFTDIKKKHSSHAITSDQTIEEHALASEFFLSDGIIVTGKTTGSEPDLAEIKCVKKSTELPVILGSGITSENISNFYESSDAFIIGSYFKENGYWENPIDPNRINKFLKAIEQIKIR
jgi:uncharacterized protein